MIDFIDIEDWLITGPMAEELSDEEQEKRRIERDFENEKERYYDDE